MRLFLNKNPSSDKSKVLALILFEFFVSYEKNIAISKIKMVNNEN